MVDGSVKKMTSITADELVVARPEYAFLTDTKIKI
jgi:hypothetical protein